MTDGFEKTVKPSSPPHLTGGAGRPFPEYATLLAHGYDSVEETYAIRLLPAFIKAIDAAKERAQENDQGEPEPFAWGEEVFHMAGHGGKGGTRYVLASSRFVIRIRNPEQDWCLSVRYLSGALWGEGIDQLRAMVWDLLALATDRLNINDVRGSLKRVDYAFDFLAPKFTDQMTWDLLGSGALVFHSSSKMRPIGTSERIETITVGSKAGLEVQIYDKGKEIHDVSGKDWMFDLWKSEGWAGPDDDGRARHIWRLECRFGKNYMRERGVNIWHDFGPDKRALVAEALQAVRLTRGNNKNRRMRSPHPLWAIADHAAGSAPSLPLGRKFTIRRQALIGMLEAQAVGLGRAISVLKDDDFGPQHAQLIAGRFERKMTSATRDERKTKTLRERYRNIDDMV